MSQSGANVGDGIGSDGGNGPKGIHTAAWNVPNAGGCYGICRGILPMTTNPYTANFYQIYLEESGASALALPRHVVRMFSPTRVVDIGCGVGTWLSPGIAVPE
jgi:hypothetical protein